MRKNLCWTVWNCNQPNKAYLQYLHFPFDSTKRLMANHFSFARPQALLSRLGGIMKVGGECLHLELPQRRKSIPSPWHERFLIDSIALRDNWNISWGLRRVRQSFVKGSSLMVLMRKENLSAQAAAASDENAFLRSTNESQLNFELRNSSSGSARLL